jgi:RNA polymerase sigma-70 factor (ECF subfamily)
MSLRARYQAAADAWPGVSVSWERFSAAAGDDLLHADDLYLALACAVGVPAAMTALDEQFLSQVPRFVARIDSSPAFADEVKQVLRERLLVGGRAIGDYRGRGALRSWLQVAALRIALNLKRSGPRLTELDDAERILATPEPELAFIKHRARADFRLAFQTALAELEPPERHLLRLHYLDRLSLAQIGAHEGVDKSTISRRLAALRQKLLDDTRRLLGERLRLDAGEIDSLMGVIASQLDVSIESFLHSR